MITVKVCRVPGGNQEVTLHDGATVGDALRAANLSRQSGEKVVLNAQDTTDDTVVHNGDRVMLVQGAKGNAAKKPAAKPAAKKPAKTAAKPAAKAKAAKK